ncbi:TetR/AcrR family transcriptional regulator [Pengzhenrongella phosphoraccumulans]|uniref:TetR/AcrR family transcriptional regulator n=1 Tax=Pengzhenrongella phosphoraccumulans TaxID=3114394 RepID=UPI00388D6EA0
MATDIRAVRRPGGGGSDRGRPRDPAVDEAIIMATLELLAERGYADLTLAAVARRAGVSTPALYRRWSDKAQLVVEAMVSRQPTTPLPDTGTTRGDLLAFTDQLLTTFTHTPAGGVLPGLVAAVAADPMLAASYRELLVEPLRRRMRAAVVRGIGRGDLRDDTDVEFALDALVGPLYVRLLITGAPIDPDYSHAAVDLVLARYISL